MTGKKHEVHDGVSLWQDTVTLKSWPRLEGVQGCDVLVIGGGMAGVLTAYRLYRQGVDVVLVEGHRVGSGVTAGTTAKITSQHGLIYQKLLAQMGTERARMYLDVHEAAIGEYAELCGCPTGQERSQDDQENNQDDRPIDSGCGFARQSHLIYSRRGAAFLEKEMDALEKLKYPARFRTGLPLPFETDGAVEFPVQASIHPLKFLKRIIEEDCQHSRNGMRIFESSRITKLRRWSDGGWEAVSEHGSVLADQVVVASHFPFIDRHGSYFMKMYQNRSLVIAGKPSQTGAAGRQKSGKFSDLFPEQLDGMYKDEVEGGLSFREAEGLLLIGGGSGRSGKVEGSWADLEHNAADFYPGWETSYRWAAQDCITLDGIPYIGPYYGESGHGLWAATGFNKWGMTGSMVSSMILSDLIQEKKNPYAEIFRPDRTMEKSQLLINAAESTVNLLKPKVPRCRHLGCALSWNEAEMSWDCPCHGSRYDETGRCIEGPSVKDLF